MNTETRTTRYSYCMSARDGGYIKSAVGSLLKYLTKELQPEGRKPTSPASVRICTDLHLNHSVLYNNGELYDMLYSQSRSIAQKLKEKTSECSSVDHIDVIFQEDVSSPFSGGRIVVAVEATKRVYVTVETASTPAPKATEPQVFEVTGERDL